MTTLASDSLDILHVSKHYAQRGAALAESGDGRGRVTVV